METDSAALMDTVLIKHLNIPLKNTALNEYLDLC